MRIRTIKPEFWESETLSLLHPLTRLLAIGLLNYADDEGYFKARPDLVKSAIFPIDGALSDPSWNVSIGMQSLKNAKFLQLYQGEDGKLYGQIINFALHQRVNRATPSTIKPLCISRQGEFRLIESSVSPHAQLTEPSLLEGKGKERNREGEGKEPTPPPDSLVSISNPFAQLADLQQRYPAIEIEAELKKALAHKRKTDRTAQTVDLAWFEAHWLPKCGPCFAPGGATQGTPAQIPPEPAGWRQTLAAEYPDNLITRENRPWAKAWKDLPPEIRAKLWPTLAA